MEIDETLEETKARMFEMLASINRSFERIISALATLEKMGVLDGDYVQNQNTITNDLWARINTGILASINAREADDRTHYGRMRATIERRIKGLR
ncbi:MAG TPA: hypothetical protein VFB79_00360 [Candidatus Angelobacter sp.]|nr:hypothetical protein [Candidatus Angelobacter sp.]